MMFFNKLYDKTKPPKLIEFSLEKSLESAFLAIISKNLTPVEQKLLIIEKRIEP